MPLSRVVGMTVCAAAMALPAVASAESTPVKNVDWSTINDSEPVVQVDLYGGYQFSTQHGGSLGTVFGFRAGGTMSHILYAGGTATFYVPKESTGFAWSPALEIGLDPPTGAFEIRPLVGAGVILGLSEVLPTMYPGVTMGYRDLRRKFFIGGEGRFNVFSTFELRAFQTGFTSLAVLGGYM